ncbi:MAG: Phospho-2-dehydro-3-deoxyheptonate aldolase [Chlamydiia bacterium]|nr:Phospho-2-dehydro-3-deoxyheptonate aldolase [Chlamydiia bacterium]MCH9615732.1 Phospho-2-dehydro-3-deoxyheptonate aldolase [Chlamydiia bacterium]MCH9628865.1 Phospho-2-dehydro-3-deoxyheptonate aldolase [Chlamydiia bacterium]
MLLILNSQAKLIDAENLMQKLSWMGLTGHLSGTDGKYTIAIVKGEDKTVDKQAFEKLPFIERVEDFEHPYKLASKLAKTTPTVIDIRGVKIGGDHCPMMAGPCSIESREQIFEAAEIIASEDVKILRGGAFKPRTSPYAFQGLGEKGLIMMREAAEKYNLVTITEVMDADQVELVAEHCDILQIGARNMQNFSLLKSLGRVKNAIFLKRGMSATYKDLLMSAEYILDQGNPVMLCERGIRTFETATRNTFDLTAIPLLHELTHLPVIADPAHGTGIRSMVTPMALASIACGADGIMVEMHPEPEKAVSDKDQTISPETFRQLMKQLRQIGPVVNKKI